MVYLTDTSVVVDLLVPGAVYEAYGKAMFDEFDCKSDLDDDNLGWIEITISRTSLQRPT